MAHVHVIDSGSPFNCPYGRVSKSSGFTQKWTPKILNCGSSSSLPDYSNRMQIVCCTTLSVSGIDATNDTIIVDGC